MMDFLLWISLIFHIIALEIVGLTIDSLIVTSIITIALLVLIYSYFTYYYLSNKGKINRLKEQYLDSLKPKKPLRFCPTDDELLARYEKSKTYKLQQKIEVQATEEENEEIEMS